eukprot:COSAG01_NODE_44981_length_413_cov_15.968153_1_plen_51_part_10
MAPTVATSRRNAGEGRNISKMSAGFHAGLNSEARDWRIAYKQSFLAKSQES